VLYVENDVRAFVDINVGVDFKADVPVCVVVNAVGHVDVKV
jgi:hypothetical protein